MIIKCERCNNLIEVDLNTNSTCQRCNKTYSLDKVEQLNQTQQEFNNLNDTNNNVEAQTLSNNFNEKRLSIKTLDNLISDALYFKDYAMAKINLDKLINYDQSYYNIYKYKAMIESLDVKSEIKQMQKVSEFYKKALLKANGKNQQLMDEIAKNLKKYYLEILEILKNEFANAPDEFHLNKIFNILEEIDFECLEFENNDIFVFLEDEAIYNFLYETAYLTWQDNISKIKHENLEDLNDYIDKIITTNKLLELGLEYASDLEKTKLYSTMIYFNKAALSYALDVKAIDKSKINVLQDGEKQAQTSLDLLELRQQHSLQDRLKKTENMQIENYWIRHPEVKDIYKVKKEVILQQLDQLNRIIEKNDPSQNYQLNLAKITELKEELVYVNQVLNKEIIPIELDETSLTK